MNSGPCFVLGYHVTFSPSQNSAWPPCTQEAPSGRPCQKVPCEENSLPFWEGSVDLVSNNSSEKVGNTDQLLMFSDSHTLETLMVEYECNIQNISQTGKTPRTVRGLAGCIPAEHEQDLVGSGGQDCSSPPMPCAGK